MPGTITPAQMFDHELNAVKGWPSPYAVDKTKAIADGEPTIYSGQVCHIDSSTGKIKKGIAVSSSVASMPLFAFPNSTGFDVSSDVGNISGGVMVGLVASGAYELETTEYSGVGLTPNVPLTVVNDNMDADFGKLVATTLDSTDLVVGVVSDGVLTNEFKKTVCRFWPVYLPYRAV